MGLEIFKSLPPTGKFDGFGTKIFSSFGADTNNSIGNF